MGSAVWQKIYFHHFNRAIACITSHLSIIVALMLQQGPSSRLQWTSLQVIDRHNCNQLTETFSLDLQSTFKELGTSKQSYLLPIRLTSLTRSNILVRSFSFYQSFVIVQERIKWTEIESRIHFDLFLENTRILLKLGDLAECLCRKWN